MGSSEKDPEQQDQETDEPSEGTGLPPFFPSWRAAYAFVIAFQFLLILLFYLFTRAYS